MTVRWTEKGPGRFQVVSGPADAERSKSHGPANCFREDPAAHSVDELSLVKHKIRLAPRRSHLLLWKGRPSRLKDAELQVLLWVLLYVQY